MLFNLNLKGCKTSCARRISILFFSFLLAACGSTLNKGSAHFQKKEYDQAAYLWSPLAKQGDPLAQYNVALLWEYGLGSTQLNKAQAAEWYLLSAKQGYPPAMVKLAEYQISVGSQTTALTWLVLAARWGNDAAISKLRNMGQPAPPADLLYQQKQKEKENLIAGILVVGAAVAAGVAASKSGGSHSTQTSSINLPDSLNDSYVPIVTNSNKTCSSDYSCGLGFSCIKKPYSSSGVCLKAVDSYGNPTYKLADPNSVKPKTKGSCMFTVDCPYGFRCDRYLQACVK